MLQYLAKVHSLRIFQVAFNTFVPHYTSSPLFQELPPAALATINSYLAKHSDIELPVHFSRLSGLVARVKDLLTGSAKKGKFLELFQPFLTKFFSFIFFISRHQCRQPSSREKENQKP